MIKDIRFISMQVVAEFTKAKEDRNLAITATGSIGGALLSINANLKDEMKTFVLQTTPKSGEEHVPLSELVPIKGVVAEVMRHISWLFLVAC